jgi:hypothetical protein
VQGPSDPAPLHPNAAGELAIALADEQAFPALSPSPVQLPAPTPTPSASTSPALG